MSHVLGSRYVLVKSTYNKASTFGAVTMWLGCLLVECSVVNNNAMLIIKRCSCWLSFSYIIIYLNNYMYSCIIVICLLRHLFSFNALWRHAGKKTGRRHLTFSYYSPKKDLNASKLSSAWSSWYVKENKYYFATGIEALNRIASTGRFHHENMPI